MSAADEAAAATALPVSQADRLARTWATPPGLWGWLTCVDA
jgi:hypothetical protein